MKLEFVCHASVILRRDPVHLICDPWLAGTAFDNGWALLSEPAFTAEDFASITHIWFSHEHPDHFSPRTLAMIPENVRAGISVLFHASEDRKVVEHCKMLGFGDVIELQPGAWTELAPDFEIRCDGWEDGDDSWLLVRTPEGKILNLNDCQAVRPSQMKALHAATGDVDVLLTQFSISSWDGNPEDIERRQAGAQAMLDRVVRQANALNAKHVVPFASFVWFCHEENAYMNQALRPVSDAAQIIAENTQAQPVVLYPGDIWNVGDDIDSSHAIERYAADIASLNERPPEVSEPVSVDELQAAAARFGAAVRQQRSLLKLRINAARMNAKHQQRLHATNPLRSRFAALKALLLMQVRPARVWLTDHNVSLDYCLLEGLRPAPWLRDDCDIELSSAALMFAFRFLWGGESLQINGRFREIYPEGRIPLFEYLWVACGLNQETGAQARPL
ncbi:MAG: MBL fold metallo-hydrolase [Gammaproteobacteria bacterium]|nr:MBL fold metallo-hydrolase [Gammaproteobacteria bacterium]